MIADCRAPVNPTARAELLATIAIDTEYQGALTLTVQAAARLDADSIAVQVYHSARIPPPPDRFDLTRYLPLTPDRYGRYCRRILLRPAQPLAPWLQGMELVCRERIDAGYVSLCYPIGQFADRIGEFRRQARAAGGKRSGADLAWKQLANTMYGVLACPHLATCNFVAANQITAQGRAEAFALGQALNAIQTITDGCSYRLDQIPACSYTECLRILPDYPLRRAEADDGIPFLDPEGIPRDDQRFTGWYREHVRRFFGDSSSAFRELIGSHDLEHTLHDGGTTAYDSQACDGPGNYVKCVRSEAGSWKVVGMSARSYGRRSRDQLAEWLVRTYSTNRLPGLAPVTEDIELLSTDRAIRLARRALEAGLEEVIFPLGLELTKALAYRIIRPSTYIFATPEQRAAITGQMQRFEERHGAGLELLALRRNYRGRLCGSLVGLAEAVHRLIRGGSSDLVHGLNLRKLGPSIEDLGRRRRDEVRRVKEFAEGGLLETIDVRQYCAKDLATGYLVTRDDMRLVEPTEAG